MVVIFMLGFFILKNETQLLLFSLIFQIEWYNHDKSATNNQFLIEKKKMETISNKIDITSFCDSTSKVNKTFGVSLKKEKKID